jgi:HD-GYP domain-containing protein (c-di-GMP phosphodiesterase class II)
MTGWGSFHLQGVDLPLGARIVSVADIFTALTEDRTFRNGLAS